MPRRPKPLHAALAMLVAAALVGGGASADDAPSLRRGSGEVKNIAAPALARQTPSEKEAQLVILMNYQDAELKQVDAGGRGIVGAIEGVAKAIEGTELGPSRHAAFQMPIAMKYERIADGLYSVSLEAGAPSINIDARLKPDVKNALEAEARTLVTRLKTWRRLLTEVEMRRLFGYDERVDIALPEPFAHVRTWGHTVPVVTLRLKAPPKPRPILRYVALSPDGEKETLYELPVGQAFWLEAQYYASPDRDASQAAAIAWPGGRLDVILQPTDRPLFFRAGPFYIAPPGDADEPGAAAGDAPNG